MSHAQIPPLAADVAALLASERTIEPQPDSVRRRALLRARAADRWQGRSSAPSAVRLWRWARRAPSVAAMAVAALVVTGLGAAVLQATWRPAAPVEAAGSRELSPQPTPPARPLRARPSPVAVPAPEAKEDEEPAKPVASPRSSSTDAGPSGELRLLQAARQAILAGNYGTALASLDAHARRYPSGRLTEEREALRVKALRGLGRSDDAQRAASDFRRQFPRSVLSPQMQ